MLNNIVFFLSYTSTSLVLVAAFTWLYTQLTPYKELELIRQGKTSAALSLGGAVMGFCLPLASAIYYTADLSEMVIWACITGCVQFLLFISMRKLFANEVEQGNTAQGALMLCLSLSAGLINAVAISH